MATVTTATARKPKSEGSIADVFSSLSGSAPVELPPRFADIKKAIWRDDFVESWREVLGELEIAVEEVAARGADVCLHDTRRWLEVG